MSNPADDKLKGVQRLARYSCMHASMTQSLLIRMSTITEAIELARATGLTASQALYNAQMIRTHSLLLRTAQREGYIIGGRQVSDHDLVTMHRIHSVLCFLETSFVCVCQQDLNDKWIFPKLEYASLSVLDPTFPVSH